MATVDDLRNQFDGLPISQKQEFLDQLKEYIGTSDKPEHKEFLNECIEKYNAEAQQQSAFKTPFEMQQASINTPTVETGSKKMKAPTNDGNIYGGTFFTPDEHQVATIGTGYIVNDLAGAGLKRAGATLTNKSIYFSGELFAQDTKLRLVSLKQRKTVSVRDVTGTGYIDYKPTYFLIAAIILTIVGTFCLIEDLSYTVMPYSIALVIGGIGIPLAIVFFILYFTRKKTLLSIEYAGGAIAFDVRWIQKEEQDNFIRNIHLVKNKLYSKTAEDQGFIATAAPTVQASTPVTTAVQSDTEEAEFCPSCGKPVKPGAAFCMKCGNSIYE